MNTNTDTLRAAREMRRLQAQMMLRKDNGYLLPEDRSWRAVWRGFRWAELWTALAAAAWLFAMWLVWRFGP